MSSASALDFMSIASDRPLNSNHGFLAGTAWEVGEVEYQNVFHSYIEAGPFVLFSQRTGVSALVVMTKKISGAEKCHLADGMVFSYSRSCVRPVDGLYHQVVDGRCPNHLGYVKAVWENREIQPVYHLGDITPEPHTVPTLDRGTVTAVCYDASTSYLSEISPFRSVYAKVYVGHGFRHACGAFRWTLDPNAFHWNGTSFLPNIVVGKPSYYIENGNIDSVQCLYAHYEVRWPMPVASNLTAACPPYGFYPPRLSLNIESMGSYWLVHYCTRQARGGNTEIFRISENGHFLSVPEANTTRYVSLSPGLVEITSYGSVVYEFSLDKEVIHTSRTEILPPRRDRPKPPSSGRPDSWIGGGLWDIVHAVTGEFSYVISLIGDFFSGLYQKTIGTVWLEIKSIGMAISDWFLNSYIPQLEKRVGLLLALLFVLGLAYVQPQVAQSHWYVVMVGCVVLWIVVSFDSVVRGTSLDDRLLDLGPELLIFGITLLAGMAFSVIRVAIWIGMAFFLYYQQWVYHTKYAYKRKIFSVLILLPLGEYRLIMAVVSALAFYRIETEYFFDWLYRFVVEGYMHLGDLRPAKILRHNLPFSWRVSAGLFVSNTPRVSKTRSLVWRRKQGLRSLRGNVIHQMEWDDFVRQATRIGMQHMSYDELNLFRVNSLPWYYRQVGELGWVYDAVQRTLVINRKSIN